PTVAWDPAAGTVDRDALQRLGPFTAVVHLAGAGIGDRRWTGGRRRELVASRVGPTRLLAGVVAAMDPPPEVLVSASAVGFYGDRGDEELSEDSAGGTGFLADLCRDWELAAATVADRVRVVHLRSGIVLDAGGGALARQLPLFRLGLGGRLGSGRQYTSWITLEDEVAVVRRAVQDDRLAGPVNAVAPDPVTNAELARALGGALHRPALLPVPRPALELALGAGMAREMVLASQRVLPARLAAAGHGFAHPTIDLALAAVLAHDG
ncbi:MAG: TIGR01777 family oxidoreductase, partial [Acidimicrobiales bacterium]